MKCDTVITGWKSPIMGTKQCTCSATRCKHTLTPNTQPLKTAPVYNNVCQENFPDIITHTVLFAAWTVDKRQNGAFTPKSDPRCHKIIDISCNRKCFSLLSWPVYVTTPASPSCSCSSWQEWNQACSCADVTQLLLQGLKRSFPPQCTVVLSCYLHTCGLFDFIRH